MLAVMADDVKRLPAMAGGGGAAGDFRPCRSACQNSGRRRADNRRTRRYKAGSGQYRPVMVPDLAGLHLLCGEIGQLLRPDPGAGRGIKPDQLRAWSLTRKTELPTASTGLEAPRAPTISSRCAGGKVEGSGAANWCQHGRSVADDNRVARHVAESAIERPRARPRRRRSRSGCRLRRRRPSPVRSPSGRSRSSLTPPARVTPITPAMASLPKMRHSTLPSLARTAQPPASRPTT